MSSSICSNLDQFKILSSGNGLITVIAIEFSPVSLFHQYSLRQLCICGKAASGLQRMLCGVLIIRYSRKAWIGAMAAAIKTDMILERALKLFWGIIMIVIISTRSRLVG